MVPCYIAALNAWDRVEEFGKRVDSFTKIIWDTKQAFIDFFKRLTSAANRMISDPDVKQILIEYFAFVLIHNAKGWLSF